MNFKIREAVKSDITILAKNNQALANETENINLNLDTIISGVSNALDREDCHYFVAEINKMVVGQTLITYEWSDWSNGLIWCCLLYTSPSPRDRSLSRMPSSA